MIGRPFLRLGRPSLLQTAARTAVVAGTATAVTGGLMRHQANRAQQQQEAAEYERSQTMPAQPAQPAPMAAPAPARASTEDLITQLRELGQLRDAGVLTEEEFAGQKAKLLTS